MIERALTTRCLVRICEQTLLAPGNRSQLEAENIFRDNKPSPFRVLQLGTHGARDGCGLVAVASCQCQPAWEPLLTWK